MISPRSLRRRRLATTFLAACAASVALALPSAASAFDHYPCGPVKGTRDGSPIQYCPLTQSGLPVFKEQYRTMAEALNSNGVVGWLRQGGCTNWFWAQVLGVTYTDGGYSNYWWGYTRADNGAEGFVSEVYFRGGANFERDRGLQVWGENLGKLPAPDCGVYVP